MTMAFDLSGVSVHIGMPVHGHIAPETTVSLIDTCCALKDKGINFELKMQFGCSIIEQARCFVADNFLASECTHLFMIDADIAWKAEDFVRVLALATKMEIVAATYPIKRDPETWIINNNGRTEVNIWGCLPVDGLGLGFCCVQRKVMQNLANRAPKMMTLERSKPIARIFRCDVDNGYFRGEDMAFCADARSIGYKVNLDPKVSLGHVGPKEFRGDFQGALEGMKVKHD